MPATKPDKDSYYQQESLRAIQIAIQHAQDNDKTLQEIRFMVRRSYPFGALRKGKPYKIWNKLVIAKEIELGLEPKKHSKTWKRPPAKKKPKIKPIIKTDQTLYFFS